MAYSAENGEKRVFADPNIVILHVISFCLRIVLDTNVMLAALRSDRGASRQLLVNAMNRKLFLLASVPLFVEYEAVLTRPEHLEVIGLTKKEVHEFLDGLAGMIEPVFLRFLWRPQLQDPADEMVLETSVNGQADRLVTFNLKHLAAASQKFGIAAVTPPQLWKEIDRHEKK